MTQLHRLLQRQLKRHFGNEASIPDEWQGFIRDVSDAYQESDIDREMLERSLELSSQELLEANLQMQAVFQALPDLLFRLDSEGVILDFKAGKINDFLHQPKDLIGKRIQEVPFKLVGDLFHEAIQRIQKEKSIITIEYSLTLQGQECFYEARLAPLLDAQIVVVIRNLTQRKKMEQALRQAYDELEERVEQRTMELKKANEQLAALYKVGQTITAPLNLNVVLNVIARSTVELLGTDTGVILLLDETREILTIQGAFGLSEKVMKGTHDRIGESIAGRVVQTGQPIIANDLLHDPRFFNPSAANEGLLACASVPLSVGGKIIGTLDVHSKSDPYAFNEKHIQTLSMLASQAAIAIENARLYEQLQLAHDELEARVQQRTAEVLAANMQLHEEIAERKRVEEALRKLNEELEHRVEARTIELKEINTALRESLETLKETQDQLIQAEKMAALGGLVAGIAHEINTPIGIGVTAVSYLEQKTQEFEKKYERGQMNRSDLEKYVKIAKEATIMILKNLWRAADQIQSFKQVAIDQTCDEQRRFKLKACIDDLLLSLHPKLSKTQHTITVHCPEDLELTSYPGVFSQILTNLILNSLSHGFEQKAQGTMMLQITCDHNMLRLQYSDDGCGMAAETRLRIFEPFYTTKRGQGGTGLGLHIVYNLVTQQLGGRIECESTPGIGTTFHIQIPIHL
ncbi:multi-sensor signal transduction histidine kinase [Candidatus Vecturithrix granuli]|uniref:histidine kinase n=1 Tax=Vecturithrix granuli TaxID=1499967 RepID=A0A081C5C1_VECG1|nr:multi-sensor signal transduction histidine kinase [Candidatus Vecturithrix granuli]